MVDLPENMPFTLKSGVVLAPVDHALIGKIHIISDKVCFGKNVQHEAFNQNEKHFQVYTCRTFCVINMFFLLMWSKQ